MTIQITQHAEGCILSVRAQPGARQNGIMGVHAGSLKVAVTAPPDQGRANDVLVEVLADALDLKRSQVALLQGMTNRQKKFLIRGLSPDALAQKLTTLLADI
jgi:uncharacterized protein (TIGR00251 family)